MGFALAGKEVFGSYAEKALNQITVFIDKADSAILRASCSGAQTVASATFDNVQQRRNSLNLSAGPAPSAWPFGRGGGARGRSQPRAGPCDPSVDPFSRRAVVPTCREVRDADHAGGTPWAITSS